MAKKVSRVDLAGTGTTGFSPTFVAGAIRLAQCDTGSTLLDPWNGSGTTTQVAFQEGHRAIGFDLNPVMVVVAKARAIDATVAPSIQSLADDIAAKAPITPLDDTLDEPLVQWLDSEGTNGFRQIERAVHALLIDRHTYMPLAAASALDSVSSLAAFFYVALFRTLRRVLVSFESSNPTWIKQPTADSKKISVSREQVTQTFRSCVLAMHQDLLQEPKSLPIKRYPPTLATASSCELPLENHSVDLAITSPPYCTRIDYVIKTSPELAILGASNRDRRALRDKMIGTPTISAALPTPDKAWGRRCLTLLDSVYDHDSYASRSYYWKTHVQYFSGLFASFSEINRALRPLGQCVVVVQDSYYKNINIDLAGIVSEMTEGHGWHAKNRVDFVASRTMADINSASKHYGRSRQLRESVLTFQKIK